MKTFVFFNIFKHGHLIFILTLLNATKMQVIELISKIEFIEMQFSCEEKVRTTQHLLLLKVPKIRIKCKT